MNTQTSASLLAALHVELGLVVSGEATPVPLIRSNSVVTNGISLVGLVEG
jgi:hypothetical protein